MSSVSFDPVAHVYDATRGFPEPVIRQLVAAIEQCTNANVQTRFLEVGVGTGRFAFPLAEAEHHYTGIDISEKMLSRLEQKLRAAGWQEQELPWGSVPDEDAAYAPYSTTHNLAMQRFVQPGKQGTMRLAIADMTAIPFHDAAFDAVLAIHVLHLVQDWQKALQEVMRVLRPGGVLVRCWREKWHEIWQIEPSARPMSTSRLIKNQWCLFAQEAGGRFALPGTSEQVVTEWLQQQGFKTEQVQVISWQEPATVRAVLDGIAQRIWTSNQLVSDAIFEVSLARLRQWIDERYGDKLDEVFMEEQRAIVSRTVL
jgi:ubiquinone/menaquinone biosynthesis C-methylase UbiE